MIEFTILNPIAKLFDDRHTSQSLGVRLGVVEFTDPCFDRPHAPGLAVDVNQESALRKGSKFPAIKGVDVRPKDHQAAVTLGVGFSVLWDGLGLRRARTIGHRDRAVQPTPHPANVAKRI